MPPVKILIITPALNASSVIGITRPLIELEKRGLVTLRLRYGSIPFGWKADCDWCDIAVFNRAQAFYDLAKLYYLKRRGKKILYDIDDNFLEIPITVKVGQNHRFYPKQYGTLRFYELADLVQVYTKRMQQQVLAHNGTPALVNSYFDRSIFENVTTDNHSNKIRIALASARTDDPTLDRMTQDVLAFVADKYGDKIELHFWRKPPPHLNKRSNVIVHTPTHRYEDFVRYFYKLNFDIGLAPLMDHPFYHSKSNNKYREYGGMGIAGLYSNVPPYNECITHLDNGYLAKNNKEEWIEGLCHLIENADARQKILTNARKDVTQHYSFDNCIATWNDHINTLIQKPISVRNDLPCLESYKPSSLKILIGASFESTANAQVDTIISVIVNAASHLKIKVGTNFLSQFYISSMPSKDDRYYVIIYDKTDLEMVMPLISQAAKLTLDLRLVEHLNDEMIIALNKMNLMADSAMPIFCYKAQADKLDFRNIILTDSIKPTHPLDYFDTNFIGLTYYRFLESFCYDKVVTRFSYYQRFIEKLYDNYYAQFQTIRRRGLQVWELILWRLGRRTQ